MSKVPMKRLDEVGTISRGKSKHRPRNDPKLYGGQYPFVQTADIKNAGLYLYDYEQTYNEVGLAQSKLWEPGTLCITIAANIADTSILGIHACFPDSVMGFIPDASKCDVRYMKYSFDMLRQQMKQISQGATQDNLSWQKLATIRFPIPDLEIQRRIADAIVAYDNLIENNRRQIALLEEAARRLYKEWFVDLRYPGHEGIGKSDGLPDKWTEKTLADIADVVMGQSPKSDYYNDAGEGLPFHQGVSSYGLRFVRDQTYTTSVTRIGKAGSILFSVRAPVGRLNYTKNEIVLGRGLAAMNHKQGLQSYLYYMLKERFFKEDMIGNGSIFASISKSDLLTQKFVVPNGELAERFDALCRPIDKQIERCDDMIKAATEARDRLLPKLMSGEIDVEG